MKLSASQVSAALRSPGSYCGLLIYGQDWGLVRERSRTVAAAVLGGASGAFRQSTLRREEHGRLRDEAGSVALGGGRKVIHVHDATDALVGTLETLRFQPSEALLVLEAGELQGRSKLRAFAERRADWGAIACFAGSSTSVLADIEAALSAAGLTASPDALAFLGDELAGESSTRRSELEKLTLYAAGSHEISIEMARASCTQSAEASVVVAVDAALAGQAELCDALLASLSREGSTGAGLLAVLSAQVQRLHKLRLQLDAGQSEEEACRALYPPVYPRQAAGLLRTARRWRPAALDALGRAIRDADIACKKAGSPDFAIASRLLAAVVSR